MSQRSAQIAALADVVYPPVSAGLLGQQSNRLSIIMAAKRDIMAGAESGNDSEHAPISSLINHADTHNHILDRFVNAGPAKTSLIAKIDRVRKGRKIVIGTTWFSVKLPPITLRDGDYSDCIDDLRVKYDLSAGSYATRVIAEDGRRNPHPMVSTTTNSGRPNVFWPQPASQNAIQSFDFSWVYDYIYKQLSECDPRYLFNTIREFRGTTCPSCGRRGGQRHQAAGATWCALCGQICPNCASTWPPQGYGIVGRVCRNCSHQPCLTCGTQTSGRSTACIGCGIRCQWCGLWWPVDTEMYVTSSIPFMARMPVMPSMLCVHCARVRNDGRRYGIRVNWADHVALHNHRENPSLGFLIYQANPSAPVIPLPLQGDSIHVTATAAT